ncbi:MAG: carboxypeptidase-like regulatory domain-containing protein [Terracidiphilus sp.]
MRTSSTNIKIVLLLFAALELSFAAAAPVPAALPGAVRVSGTVLDPSGRPVAGAKVEFSSAAGARLSGMTGGDGRFNVTLPAWGEYTVRVESKGLRPVTRRMQLNSETASLTLRLEQVAGAAEEVIVTGDVSEVTLTSPDPSEKVLVREELLDANPGRPGAPISIPGLPIETASGGIKAPQYFVPGVAGDHGEPIAQYIAVGGYLVTNNLSANAHGNGYADPNIYVSGALGSVTTDGGAFNVLEGNHALNLAATYNPRTQLSRFVTLTGDYRDADLTAGFAPRDSQKKQWVALEANFGNGLMKRLEHRQQYKWNALRVFDAGRHEITLFSVEYWGKSHEGNLVPLGYGLQLGDTIDPRQMDQTHTALVAANDRWTLRTNDEIAFSGFIRTYNLALYSNFGEGLIRQSEFRTVEGAEARETHTFTPWLQGMAGIEYHEDDIHRDDLDHYLSAGAQVYGAFVKVLSNNVTIRDATPYAALHGDVGKHVRFYGGLRPDMIELKNTDMINSANSFDEWKAFVAPKATVTLNPGTGPARWLPSVSFSMGQAFFTQDPRTAVEKFAAPQAPSPFERSHSEQLVLEKQVSATDVRVTVGRTTTTETLGKIDPDNGTQQPLGPGTLKFFTASARHPFSFGTVQAVFSKADARLLGATIGGVTIPPQVTPEAPRTIFDALATLDRLPLGLHGRGEYEYVGKKQLDLGNPQHPSTYEAIPVGETRMAVVRSFLNGRLEVGADGELTRGYTGQTTETFAPGWVMGASPYCGPGSGPSGLANDFDCGTNEQSVGVRMVSWAGGSISWRFGAGK